MASASRGSHWPPAACAYSPTCPDLLQGPLIYDDLENIATHFDPVWRGQMWGTWATDPRGLDPDGDPFDIPMQGMGAFSCRKSAWPGFNPAFRGFGGEEGYIHEKVRQAGGRSLCLPWLRWTHRFGRPAGVPYPLTVEDKLRNYVIGHTELGLDLAPVLEHFAEHMPEATIITVVEQALREGITGPAPSPAASLPSSFPVTFAGKDARVAHTSPEPTVSAHLSLASGDTYPVRSSGNGWATVRESITASRMLLLLHDAGVSNENLSMPAGEAVTRGFLTVEQVEAVHHVTENDIDQLIARTNAEDTPYTPESP